MSDDEIEEYRISTQLEVLDRYFNKTSSDGFYIYLYENEQFFKDNGPKDLYMKLMFNRLGYGREYTF